MENEIKGWPPSWPPRPTTREVFKVSDGVDFVVFTPEETGAPELHEGAWHFEPFTDYEGCGEVFSEGYPTREEAKRAATKYALGEYLRLHEAR